MAQRTGATTTKDARGRRATLLDPVAMHLLREHNVIDAETLRTIANEDGLKMNWVERTSLVVGILGALAVISLFTIALAGGGIRNAPYAKSSGLIYLCSIPWIAWYGMKRRRLGHIAGAMLQYRRCPHCGYNLRLLPVDPADGATVCPECGCAWLLENADDPDAAEDQPQPAD